MQLTTKVAVSVSVSSGLVHAFACARVRVRVFVVHDFVCVFIMLPALSLARALSRLEAGDALRGAHYPAQWHGGEAAGIGGNMAAMLQQQQQQQFMQQRRLHQQQVFEVSYRTVSILCHSFVVCFEYGTLRMSLVRPGKSVHASRCM